MTTAAGPALRVGLMPAAHLSRVARNAWRLGRSSGIPVSIEQAWATPRSLARLRSGEFDVLFLVGPVPHQPELVCTLVGREGCDLFVHERHPLRTRAVLRFEDFLDLPTFRRPDDALPQWRSFWHAEQLRGGSPRFTRASAATEWDAIVAIGSGQAIGYAPRSWRPGNGVVALPVLGGQTVEVVALRRPPGADGSEQRGRSRLVERLIEATAAPEQPPVHTLTPAQLRVARLVADGLDNLAIAAELHLSVRTVEAHVTGGLRRLGLRSRAHLAAHVTRAFTQP